MKFPSPNFSLQGTFRETIGTLGKSIPLPGCHVRGINIEKRYVGTILFDGQGGTSCFDPQQIGRERELGDGGMG